jgi:hypothetical protein
MSMKNSNGISWYRTSYLTIGSTAP